MDFHYIIKLNFIISNPIIIKIIHYCYLLAICLHALNSQNKMLHYLIMIIPMLFRA